MMLTYLPRDFIETQERFIFAVVAHGTEQGRALAFLRYVPVGARWRKVGTDEAQRLLSSRYPQYLYYSAMRDVHLHGVPLAAIRKIYRPRSRMRDIVRKKGCDSLEDKAARLLTLFTEQGLDQASVGITGSMLIGQHNRDSDIDLVIYGRSPFHRARGIIEQLVADGVLQGLDDDLWRGAYARRGCSLTLEEFVWHERRKYNKAAIAGTKFDIGMVTERAPSLCQRFRKQGKLKTRAIVSNDCYAFDYPARYLLDGEDVAEVVSYTATYVGQARTGETIEVLGMLEGSEKGEWRVLVGTTREASGEYIKVIQT